ncbi:hypothetical protein, partial [Pantoea ananatis]
SNHKLFGNVKVIHKYNVRSSLIADLQLSQHVRSVPEADIIVATHAQMMACVLEDESPPLDAGFFQTYTINYSSLIYVMA